YGGSCVTGRRPALALVEPDVAPVTRPPLRHIDRATVDQAEGSAMALQNLPDLVVEPRGVAGLDSDPCFTAERRQGRVQSSWIAREVRRELQQDGAKARAKSGRPFQQPGHGLRRVQRSEE